MKAIETEYNGYKFRSRTEARWAVFFDTLGIKYEYEKEGFDLGEAGWYLPDFWLPDVYDRDLNKGVWIEIKGQEPSDIENSKCCQLAIQSTYSVIILVGVPNEDSTDFSPHTQWTYKNKEAGWDNDMKWHYCGDCKVAKIEFSNDYYRCPICAEQSCVKYHRTLELASIAARRARFEYGETPKILKPKPTFHIPNFEELEEEKPEEILFGCRSSVLQATKLARYPTLSANKDFFEVPVLRTENPNIKISSAPKFEDNRDVDFSHVKSSIRGQEWHLTCKTCSYSYSFEIINDFQIDGEIEIFKRDHTKCSKGKVEDCVCECGHPIRSKRDLDHKCLLYDNDFEF